MSVTPIQILENKQRSIRRNRYVITPDLDEFSEHDAILEGRGRGVPHAVFFDTRDKVAIFPSDIPGYGHLFNADGYAWRDNDGWKDKATRGDIETAHAALLHLQQCLRECGHDAELVCAKGHNKGYFDGLDVDATADSRDFVLWVYTESDDLVDLLQGHTKSD